MLSKQNLLLFLDLIIDISMTILIKKVSWFNWLKSNEIFWFFQMQSSIFQYSSFSSVLASSSDFISWKLLLCLELIIDIPMIILIAKVSWLMWFELNEIFFFLDLIADIFDWWLSLKRWVCSLDCYSMKSSSLPKFNSRSLDDYSHWQSKLIYVIWTEWHFFSWI